jgi:hypothetical protein
MKVTEMSEGQKTYPDAFFDITKIVIDLVDTMIERYDGKITQNYTGRLTPYPPHEFTKNLSDLFGEAANHVLSRKSDRHKQAACVCGAVMHAKPIVLVNDYDGKDQRYNFVVALFVSLYILKSYMVAQYMKDHYPQSTASVIDDLCKGFTMAFPSLEENTCDKRPYEENLMHALIWSARHDIKYFDILAYAKIFYHLEHYNLGRLREYMVSKSYPPKKSG